MNLLKWLFLSRKPALNKPDVSGAFAKNTTTLNERQWDNAYTFYFNHKDHIDNMISDTKLAYEPSEVYDKNDPRIWKAEYWKWFLANCH